MSANSWEDARRREAWADELRVNLIRSLVIAALSTYHLLYLPFVAVGKE
jgi:hypothetical protein